MPACLAKPPPPEPPAPLAPPTRHTSATEAQWLEWHQQQLDALAAAEGKAAARNAAAGPASRGPAREPSSPRACSATADGSAGTGVAPFLFEQRFMDRASPRALHSARRRSPLSASTVTPPWIVLLPRLMPRCTMMRLMPKILPAAATTMTMPSVVVRPLRFGPLLMPLWISWRTGLTPSVACRRMTSSWPGRTCSPGAFASCGCPCPRLPPPLTPVLRAKRATDKRRRHLQRFIVMRDGFLAEERALQSTIVDAHATIAATQRFLTLAETEEYECFCSYASSLDAPRRVPSPEAAGSASADAARRAGHDPVVAAGVSGIITQLLMLPTASEASNLGAAYAAVLEQARLVHKGLTGDMGPTLVPDPPSPGRVPAGGGGVPPRMAWAPGSPGPDPPGMPMPFTGAAALAPAAPPSATGPPVSHGGYAGVVLGGSAPTPAEAAGHEARARAASRGLERSRPPAVLPSAGSRGEERERSPRGTSAWAALAAAAAAADADFRVSTDDYMPDAEPDVPAGGARAPSCSACEHRVWDLIGGPRNRAAEAVAVLRCTPAAGAPAAGVEAARAAAATAQAAADAAPAAHAAPACPLPRDIKPLYMALPAAAMAPFPAGVTPPPVAASDAESAAGPVPVPAAPAGDAAAPPDAPLGVAAGTGDAAAIPAPVAARPGRPSHPWAARAAGLVWGTRSMPVVPSSSRRSPRPTPGPPLMCVALPNRAMPGTPMTLPALTFKGRRGRALTLPPLGLPWSPE